MCSWHQAFLWLKLANFKIVRTWDELNALVLHSEHAHQLRIDRSSLCANLRVQELFKGLPDSLRIFKVICHSIFQFVRHILIKLATSKFFCHV